MPYDYFLDFNNIRYKVNKVVIAGSSEEQEYLKIKNKLESDLKNVDKIIIGKWNWYWTENKQEGHCNITISDDKSLYLKCDDIEYIGNVSVEQNKVAFVYNKQKHRGKSWEKKIIRPIPNKVTYIDNNTIKLKGMGTSFKATMTR